MTTRSEFDVVVIGAGSAGAAAAWFLARDGRKVALVESRAWSNGGARWVDDVPPWMFDRAGIERPVAPVKRCDHVPITLLSCSTRVRVPVGLRPMWALDMRALTDHLRSEALRAGVTGFERASPGEAIIEHHRPVGLRLHARALDSAPVDLELRARLFVDASGVAQGMLRRVPALASACPPVLGADICTATQQVREVADRDAALAFVRRHGAGPGHVLSFMGVHGGYSSLMVHLEPDVARVELLAGVVDEGDRGTGTQLLAEFIRRHPWVGPIVFGGAGRIPIRRPYDRLCAPGIALLGDAACQTFPAHGSGVGSGLIGARMLADAVRGQDDAGAEQAVWAYQSTFQRERGGVNAAYDVFRRAVQRLDGADIEALMEAGLIEPKASSAALNQQLATPRMLDMARMARSAMKMPGRSANLVTAALRMPLVRRVYERHPSSPDDARLRRWADLAARVCGHRADV